MYIIFSYLTYGQEVSLDTSRKKERGTLFHEYLYIHMLCSAKKNLQKLTSIAKHLFFAFKSYLSTKFNYNHDMYLGFDYQHTLENH